MSKWTHVNGCIRIDGIPGLPGSSKDEVEKIIGVTYHPFDNDSDIRELCTVPYGSEGSLYYDIISAGDGLVLWTVPIWGDLRDFTDVDSIKGWFDKITKGSVLRIRSAIIEIEVECGEKIVLSHEEEA